MKSNWLWALLIAFALTGCIILLIMGLMRVNAYPNPSVERKAKVHVIAVSNPYTVDDVTVVKICISPAIGLFRDGIVNSSSSNDYLLATPIGAVPKKYYGRYVDKKMHIKYRAFRSGKEIITKITAITELP